MGAAGPSESVAAVAEDLDNDGFGNLSVAITACVRPVGYADAGTDCNDADVDNWASCATCVDSDADLFFVGCDAYGTRSGPGHAPSRDVDSHCGNERHAHGQPTDQQ